MTDVLHDGKLTCAACARLIFRQRCTCMAAMQKTWSSEMQRRCRKTFDKIFGARNRRVAPNYHRCGYQFGAATSTRRAARVPRAGRAHRATSWHRRRARRQGGAKACRPIRSKASIRRARDAYERAAESKVRCPNAPARTSNSRSSVELAAVERPAPRKGRALDLRPQACPVGDDEEQPAMGRQTRATPGASAAARPRRYSRPWTMTTGRRTRRETAAHPLRQRHQRPDFGRR